MKEENIKYEGAVNTSIWAFLQTVFLQAGALITTMYLTRVLLVSEYALIPLLNSFALLLVIFIGFGLPASLARFLAAQNSRVNQRKLLFNALSVSLPIILIMTILVYLIFPILVSILGVEELLHLNWVFVCILILELIRVFIEKICHGTGNMKISASFSAWASISVVMVTVPSVWYSPTAFVAVLAKVIALLLPTFRACLSLNKVFKEDSIADDNPLPTTKSVISYGFPLAAISLSGFGFVQLDILLLAYYDNVNIVGIYSVGVMLLVRMVSMSRSIGFGVSPAFAMSDIDNRQRSLLFMKGLKYALIFSVPIAIYIGTESSAVMGGLFGSKYANSGYLMPVLCVYFLMASMLAIASPALDFSGKAKVRAYGAIAGACVNLVFNILLIPKYGGLGAAVATVFGYSVLFFITLSSVFTSLDKRAIRDIQITRLLLFVLPVLLVLVLIIKVGMSGDSYLVNAALLAMLYPTLLIKLNILSREEVDKIQSLVLRK